MGVSHGGKGFRAGQPLETGFGGQLDIDAQPVGMPSGRLNQAATGKGNALEMNISVEPLPAKHLGASNQVFHGVVRAAHDP
jgi:hypothetical protein